MTPLLISGITSLASSAIDAWSNVAQRKVAVEEAKFTNAFNKAMSNSPVGMAAQAQAMQPTAPQLENQLRNAPEIRGILDAQLPSRPASLQVSAEGRVWLQVAGNQPTELVVSQDTQNLARQLNSALQGASPRGQNLSGAQPGAGSLVTLHG
jgi:hypothetical protein